jgi:hypothetical protein
MNAFFCARAKLSFSFVRFFSLVLWLLPSFHRDLRTLPSLASFRLLSTATKLERETHKNAIISAFDSIMIPQLSSAIVGDVRACDCLAVSARKKQRTLARETSKKREIFQGLRSCVHMIMIIFNVITFNTRVCKLGLLLSFCICS